jgi:hypothetical protein
VQPTLFRRGLSCFAICAVAALLGAAALSDEVAGALWRALLALAGLGMLALARRFWRATDVSLELTREVLRDSQGRVLFRIDEIQQIDRGIFALKPSNGLSVRLKAGGGYAWEPGLWWQMGRRIGIGGATAPAQARAIADGIALIQAEEAGAETR